MIHVGDCLQVMPTLEADSFDSIVTDPPYGLGFMGKAWDHSVPGVPFWLEMLRVAKPGAYLAAFGGTRTFHRMACAIEDAGWEIRDTLMWVYGSGFPKSLDVSKAIDKAAGAEREVIEVRQHRSAFNASGTHQAFEAETTSRTVAFTAPATDAARQWQGWGTALKPAWEPIILARKPLDGTVAANVMAHGTGALNIDGCRVATTEKMSFSSAAPFVNSDGEQGRTWNPSSTPGVEREQSTLGRWPANVIHDGSEEVLACFPDAPGQQGDLTGHSRDRLSKHAYGDMKAARDAVARGDAGSAARFFYCAKATRADRDDGCEHIDPANVHGPSGDGRCWDIPGSNSKPKSNNHPTVKPTDLMRWLCRLVTPPGGVVLDPFAGSGSTGRGAIAEGFRFVGIELSPEYAAIAEARIRAVQPGLALGGVA